MTQISSQALGRYIDRILQNPDMTGQAAGGDFALLFALPLAMAGEGQKTPSLGGVEDGQLLAEDVDVDLFADATLAENSRLNLAGLAADLNEDLPETALPSDEDQEVIANALVAPLIVPETSQGLSGTATADAGTTPIVTLDADLPDDGALVLDKKDIFISKPDKPLDRGGTDLEFDVEVELSRQLQPLRNTSNLAKTNQPVELEPEDTPSTTASQPFELRPRRRGETREFQMLTSNASGDDGGDETENSAEMIPRTRSLSAGPDSSAEGVRPERVDRSTQISSHEASLAQTTRAPSTPLDRGAVASEAAANGPVNAEAGETMLDFMKRDWQEKLGARLVSSLERGEQEIDLQLHPKSLGKLRISLALAEGDVRVRVIAESSLTASLLSEAEVRLAHSLEQSGLRMSQYTATWSGERQSQDQPNHQREKSGSRGEKNRAARAETIHDDADLVNSARNVHPSSVNVTA